MRVIGLEPDTTATHTTGMRAVWFPTLLRHDE